MSSNYANVTNECGKLRGAENTEKYRLFSQCRAFLRIPIFNRDVEKVE
jgi:hypothetical protein